MLPPRLKSLVKFHKQNITLNFLVVYFKSTILFTLHTFLEINFDCMDMLTQIHCKYIRLDGKLDDSFFFLGTKKSTCQPNRISLSKQFIIILLVMREVYHPIENKELTWKLLDGIMFFLQVTLKVYIWTILPGR